MSEGGEPRDFDATRAEIFEAISHPIRIKILQALSERPMGFSELGRAVGIESGGHLTFHLNKLRYLVAINRQGLYALTNDGKEALWSVNALQQSTAAAAQSSARASVRHRDWTRPILAGVVIAVIVLSSVWVYQEEQFLGQQQQIASQQKLIGAIQAGVPFVDGQNASLVIGQKDFITYGKSCTQECEGTLRNGLSYPQQALFDASGNLWVSDAGNNRILEFKPPFGNGMNASLVIGQDTFTTAFYGFGSRSSFFGASTIAFDPSGNLWVTDGGGSRILEFKPQFSNGMNASIVIGQERFTTDFALASRNGLGFPTRTVFDSSGNMWVLDGGNNRVLEFRPPFSNSMNASLVIGQRNFEESDPSAGLNGLNSVPGDLQIDSSNNLWVGDIGNNRILEFRPPFSSGMNASLVISQQNLVTSGQGLVPFVNLGSIIQFDPAGNLWAVGSNRLLVFRPPFIASVRPFPSVEIGAQNFTSAKRSGGRNGFGQFIGDPGFDPYGNLWVPDGENNRILEFTAGAGATNTASAAQPPQLLGQFQLTLIIGVAAATLGVVGALTVVRARSKGLRSRSSDSSRVKDEG